MKMPTLQLANSFFCRRIFRGDSLQLAHHGNVLVKDSASVHSDGLLYRLFDIDLWTQPG